ncbi:hypothetical protein M8J75_000755 [Diaphorina citri]|nr:hypothetical protein M8J75_000755 [Diaphorina citri]
MSSSSDQSEEDDPQSKNTMSSITSILRDAIIAKLQELGAPKNATDTALCDYIMLIASSKIKKKAEIVEEFRFILNEKTEEFVEWYLEICEKLNSIEKKKGKAQSKVKKKSSKKKGYTGISSSLLQQLTNDLTKNYMPKSGPGESEDALNREIDMLVNSKTIEGGNSEEYALHLTSGDLPIIKTEGSKVTIKTESSSEDDLDTVAIKAAPEDKLDVSSSDESEPEDGMELSTSQENENSRASEDVSAVNTDDLPLFKVKSVPPNSNLTYDGDKSSSDQEQGSPNNDDTDADEMSIDGSGDETQLNKANKKSTEEHKDPDSRNPKRPILDEAPAKPLSPEPELVVNTPIPSVISQPSKDVNRCVIPSQILIKAMRDANKSTVAASSRNCQVQAQNVREDEQLIIKVEEAQSEEEEEAEGEEEEEYQPSHVTSTNVTSSEDDRDYYYAHNEVDEATDPSAESGAQELDQSDSSGLDVPRRASPTFVVTMNKGRDEYLPPRRQAKRMYQKFERMKSVENVCAFVNRNRGNSEEDKRIVKVESVSSSKYRTRSGSDDEEDMRQEYKRFKHDYEKARSEYRNKRKKASSDSTSEDEASCKKQDRRRSHEDMATKHSDSPKLLQLRNLKIDNDENSNNKTLGNMNTPPPPYYDPNQVAENNNNNNNENTYSDPGSNHALSNYYNTMEQWIADPNYPAAFDLPPPMPLPVPPPIRAPRFVPPSGFLPPPRGPPPPMPPGFLPPPPMPPGFLPPPPARPSGYLPPPPMPPGYLPPPPMPTEFLPPPSTQEPPPLTSNNPVNPVTSTEQSLPTSSYEINVKVPAQKNDNLITVKCQKLGNQKPQDKVPCKFYPNCSKTNCPFFHRTVCASFPSCRFGKDCVYQHPPCKFGSTCSRADCAFDHTLAPKQPTAPKSSDEICKFHPKCYKRDCPFFHPKVCMYLSNCKNNACVFYHPIQYDLLLAQQKKITPLSGSLCKISNKFSMRRVVVKPPVFDLRKVLSSAETKLESPPLCQITDVFHVDNAASPRAIPESQTSDRDSHSDGEERSETEPSSSNQDGEITTNTEDASSSNQVESSPAEEEPDTNEEDNTSQHRQNYFIWKPILCLI